MGARCKFPDYAAEYNEKYGAVVDDFGMEGMLSKMMDDFVHSIAKVLFPEVGVSTLNSHHDFLVEYGRERDVELGFLVDDSEVTLNVCLGEHFLAGNCSFAVSDALST